MPEKLVWKCSSPHQPDASEFFRGKFGEYIWTLNSESESVPLPTNQMEFFGGIFGEYIWTLNSVWGKYKRKKRFQKRRKRDQTEGTLSEHSIKRASLLFVFFLKFRTSFHKQLQYCCISWYLAQIR